MTRFNIRAIFIGTLAMLAIDILSGLAVFTYFAGDSLASGATREEVSSVATAMEQSSDYLLVSLLSFRSWRNVFR